MHTRVFRSKGTGILQARTVCVWGGGRGARRQEAGSGAVDPWRGQSDAKGSLTWADAMRALLLRSRSCRLLPAPVPSECRTEVVGSSTITPLRPSPLSLKYSICAKGKEWGGEGVVSGDTAPRTARFLWKRAATNRKG
jgi:hypothetical protein